MTGSKTPDHRSTKSCDLSAELLLMFSSNCYCVRLLMCLFIYFQFSGENPFVIAPVEMYRHEQ